MTCLRSPEPLQSDILNEWMQWIGCPARARSGESTFEWAQGVAFWMMENGIPLKEYPLMHPTPLFVAVWDGLCNWYDLEDARIGLGDHALYRLTMELCDRLRNVDVRV